MKNYVEKYAPSGEFEKSKVRVLVRGDLQHVIGETEGPVTRVESIFILMMNSGALRLSRTSGRRLHWTCLGLARRLGRIGTLANA